MNGYFHDMSIIDNRLSYLEDVVKTLADSIQKVNASNKVLSDAVKELLEDMKKPRETKVSTSKQSSNRTTRRATTRNDNSDSK